MQPPLWMKSPALRPLLRLCAVLALLAAPALAQAQSAVLSADTFNRKVHVASGGNTRRAVGGGGDARRLAGPGGGKHLARLRNHQDNPRHSREPGAPQALSGAHGAIMHATSRRDNGFHRCCCPPIHPFPGRRDGRPLPRQGLSPAQARLRTPP